MKREDIQKLMGGYAAGILTDEERRELFAAALDDQALFDELMREQPLRELLEDPSTRREIEQAVARPEPRRWLWAIPATVALASAALLVMLVQTPEPAPVEMARVTIERAPYVPAPDAPPPSSPVQPQRPAARQAAPVSRKAESAAALPPPPVVALAPPANLEIPVAAEAQQLSLRDAAPQQQDTARAAKTTEEVRAAAAPPPPAPPPASAPGAFGVRRASGARALFYGISEQGLSLFRRAKEAPEPQLGLRYTRVGGTLTVETNAAAHVSIVSGEDLIFDQNVAARSRSTVSVPDGKPLRITVQRLGPARSEASRVVQEQVADEAATYAVAERGATSLTIDLP